MINHPTVLVFANDSGPQLVATIPADPKAAPATFGIGPAAGYAMSALRAKGAKVAWADYADSLTRGSPYFGSWDIREVPESMSLRDTLNWLKVHQGLIDESPDS